MGSLTTEIKTGEENKSRLLTTLVNISVEKSKISTTRDIPKDVTENESINQTKEKRNLSAVEDALTVLLGDKPSEENKITSEQFAVVLELDGFLQENERKEEESLQRVDDLVSKAIVYIEDAITLRERIEKRLLANH